MARADLEGARKVVRGAHFCGSLAIMALLGMAGQGVGQVPGLSGTVVVVNKGAASVTVVDVGSGRELAVLATGSGPHEVALTRDGRTAVVTDYGAQQAGRTLTVIDLPGLRVERTIDLGRHGRPHGIALLPDDRSALVTSEVTGSVVVVDIRTGRIERVLQTEQEGSHMLALGHDPTHVWTSNIRDGTVSEIELGGTGDTQIIAVASQPEAIGVAPDGTEVWVGSNAEGTVSILDPLDDTVSPVLDGFGWPYRILFSQDGQTVLIPDLRSEELRIVDRASRSEIHRIQFAGGAPQGLALTDDGGTAFQSLSARDEIAVIDVRGGTLIGRLPAGHRPDGIAYSRVVLDED